MSHNLEDQSHEVEREGKKEGSREEFRFIVTEGLSQDCPSGMAGILQE